MKLPDVHCSTHLACSTKNSNMSVWYIRYIIHINRDCPFQAASLGGPLALGATMGSFTVPQSLRIARAISNATSIPADVAHHAVSQALMQPGTHGSGSGGSDKLPTPAAIRSSLPKSKRDRASPLKNVSTAGLHCTVYLHFVDLQAFTRVYGACPLLRSPWVLLGVYR